MEFGSGFDQESIGQIKVFLRLWEHKRRDSKPRTGHCEDTRLSETQILRPHKPNGEVLGARLVIFMADYIGLRPFFNTQGKNVDKAPVKVCTPNQFLGPYTTEKAPKAASSPLPAGSPFAPHQGGQEATTVVPSLSCFLCYAM